MHKDAPKINGNPNVFLATSLCLNTATVQHFVGYEEM